jgi:hypothetical protein
MGVRHNFPLYNTFIYPLPAGPPTCNCGSQFACQGERKEGVNTFVGFKVKIAKQINWKTKLLVLKTIISFALRWLRMHFACYVDMHLPRETFHLIEH